MIDVIRVALARGTNGDEGNGLSDAFAFGLCGFVDAGCKGALPMQSIKREQPRLKRRDFPCH